MSDELRWSGVRFGDVGFGDVRRIWIDTFSGEHSFYRYGGRGEPIPMTADPGTRTRVRVQRSHEPGLSRVETVAGSTLSFGMDHAGVRVVVANAAHGGAYMDGEDGVSEYFEVHPTDGFTSPVSVALESRPTPPDAVMVPRPSGCPDWVARLEATTAIAEPILAVDRRRGERAWVRAMKGGVYYFVTRDPADAVLFPRGHPRSGEGRYRWQDFQDGVLVGYLVDESSANIQEFSSDPQ